MQDVYELTFLTHLKRRSVSEKPVAPVEKQENVSFVKKVFFFFYGLCTFPNMMDLFFLVVLALVFFQVNLSAVYSLFYCVCLLLIVIFKLSYIILSKKIDKELKSEF